MASNLPDEPGRGCFAIALSTDESQAVSCMLFLVQSGVDTTVTMVIVADSPLTRLGHDVTDPAKSSKASQNQ
jgi:hypothetical protein